MGLRIPVTQILGVCLLQYIEYVSSQGQECGIWGMPCPRGPCAGFTCGDNTKCSGGDGCVCLYGYERPCTEKSTATISCIDIDECSLGTHRCPISQSRCQNAQGGYQCIPYCKAGYRNLATGRLGAALNCRDVDECASRTQICGARSSCENTLGSFRCACSQGYRGDGITCIDIDECSSFNGCHPDATCSNTYGSYTCTCNDGFVGNGRTCISNRQDIDECSSFNACHPDATCSNTDGSYTCTCNDGFVGNGQTCISNRQDIDECASPNDCHDNATCTNTIGSFLCTCLPAFTGDGRQSCTALDGCIGKDFCHESAQCEIINDRNPNNITSLCRCRSGFTGDGVLNCSDINVGTTEIATNDQTLAYLGIGLAILASILTAFILLWLIRRKRQRRSPLFEEEDGQDNPAVDIEGVTIEPVRSTQEVSVDALAPDSTQIPDALTAPIDETFQSIEPPSTPETLSTAPATNIPDVVTEASVETIQPVQQAHVGAAPLAAEETFPGVLGGSTVNVTSGGAGYNVDTGLTTPSASTPSSVMDSTLPVIDEIEVWQGPVSVQ